MQHGGPAGATVTAGRVMTQAGCLFGKGHGMEGCCTIYSNPKAVKMWDCTTCVPGGSGSTLMQLP
jgi:hypothetical protein